MSTKAYLEQERDRLSCHGKCNPLRAVLVRRLNEGGVLIAGWHCQECGCWKAVKKAAVPDVGLLPEYEAQLQERIFAARNAAWEAERQAKADSWWRRYTAYLKTERWQRKRELVIARDITCQACLSRPATQAHHLTYEHVGDEPLFDLKGVCEPCHVKITQLDRERRASGITPLDKEGR